MSKVVAVYQLQLFPRIHVMKRVADCDVWVMMDDHQFGPHWQKRTLIKAAQGVQYLSVPFRGSQRQHIRDIVLDHEQPWRHRFLETLRHAYGRAPHYEEIAAEVRDVLYSTDELYELLKAAFVWAALTLDIPTELVEQTSLGDFTGLHKSPLMLAVSKAAGATVFYCRADSVNWYDQKAFSEAGIEIRGQVWEHPTYPQLWGEFVPCLSILDALFNVGVEGTRALLGLQEHSGGK